MDLKINKSSLTFRSQSCFSPSQTKQHEAINSVSSLCLPGCWMSGLPFPLDKKGPWARSAVLMVAQRSSSGVHSCRNDKLLISVGRTQVVAEVASLVLTLQSSTQLQYGVSTRVVLFKALALISLSVRYHSA